MTEAKRIGLIGLGIWGKLILKELLQLGARVSVFDSDESKLSSPSNAMAGAQAVGSLDELRETDGLVIASPSTTHCALIVRLSEFGLPMFVEKPLTTSVADARQLQSFQHLPIFVMHIWKYHPGVRTLAGVASSGVLGEILFAKSMRTNWTSPRTDTDSLWNLAPHDLTIAESILGHIPKPRCASAEVHNGVVRGLTAILGDTPAYCFEVSNRYLDKRREIRVHGTQGIAILEDEKATSVKVYLGDDESQVDDIRAQEHAIAPNSALTEELKCFLGFLDGGPPPPTDLEEGIRVVEVIEDLRQRAGL